MIRGLAPNYVAAKFYDEKIIPRDLLLLLDGGHHSLLFVTRMMATMSAIALLSVGFVPQSLLPAARVSSSLRVMAQPVLIMPTGWAARAALATGTSAVVSTVFLAKRSSSLEKELVSLRGRLDEEIKRVSACEIAKIEIEKAARSLREGVELEKTKAKLLASDKGRLFDNLEEERKSRRAKARECALKSDEVRQLTSTTKKLEKQLDKERVQLQTVESQLKAQLAKVQSELDAEIKDLRVRLAEAEEACVISEEAETQAKVELIQGKAMADDEVEGVRSQLEAAEAARKAAEEARASMEGDLAKAAEKAAEESAAKAIAETRELQAGKVTELEAKLSALRAELSTTQAQLDTVNAPLKALAACKTELAAVRNTLDERAAAMSGQLSTGEKAWADFDAEAGMERAAVVDGFVAASQLAEAKGKVDAINWRRAQLQEKVGALEAKRAANAASDAPAIVTWFASLTSDREIDEAKGALTLAAQEAASAYSELPALHDAAAAESAALDAALGELGTKQAAKQAELEASLGLRRDELSSAQAERKSLQRAANALAAVL